MPYKADKNKKNLEPENPSPKWLSVRLRTKWLWVRVQLQSPKLLKFK